MVIVGGKDMSKRMGFVDVKTIRKKFPAVASMADSYVGCGVCSLVEMPCVGEEQAVVERLQVLLSDLAIHVNELATLFDMEWAAVMATDSIQRAVADAIIIAATGFGDDDSSDPGFKPWTRMS